MQDRAILVAVASARSGLHLLVSLRRCLVFGARRWSGGSVAWGIFGLQGFPLESSLDTEHSATSYLFMFRVASSKLFLSHSITR